MSDEKLKVYSFDFGTVSDEKDTVKIEMNSSQFTYSQLDEIKVLPTDNDSLFLPKTTIKESDDSILFYYQKSAKLKNMLKLKKEEYPVKISIAEEILEQDILKKYENDNIFISLDPSTLYYYPMQTVRYTYAGNRFMPKGEATALEQYKACIVSLLSNIPYEKCLNSPQDVAKEGNELIKEIYNQTSKADLLHFVKQSEDFITYDYISNNQLRERKLKRKNYFILATVGILFAGAIVFTQVNSSHAQLDIAEQYETQLQEKDKLVEANNAFYQGDYDKAIALYSELDYDSEQLAKQLITKNEYQHAIDVDGNSLEATIEKIYETGNLEVLSTLDDKNLSEEQSRKLTNEKNIVAGDPNAMVNILNFISDENTAERLTQRFIQLNDMTHAEQVLEKYPDNQTISDIISLGENISEKNSQKNDEDDDEKKDEIQGEIDNLISQLNNWFVTTSTPSEQE